MRLRKRTQRLNTKVYDPNQMTMQALGNKTKTKTMTKTLTKTKKRRTRLKVKTTRSRDTKYG